MMGLAEEGTQKECEGENEKPEVNGTREPGDGTSTVSSQSIELEEIINGADNIVGEGKRVCWKTQRSVFSGCVPRHASLTSTGSMTASDAPAVRSIARMSWYVPAAW